MTVQAWIDSLSKLDRGLDVLVRVQGAEDGPSDGVIFCSQRPSFSVDAGCTETDMAVIDMSEDDEGVDEVLVLGPPDHSDAEPAQQLDAGEPHGKDGNGNHIREATKLVDTQEREWRVRTLPPHNVFFVSPIGEYECDRLVATDPEVFSKQWRFTAGPWVDADTPSTTDK